MAVMNAPLPQSAERAFYVEEFSGSTIVIAVVGPREQWVEAVGDVSRSLSAGGSRLVVVSSDEAWLTQGGRDPFDAQVDAGELWMALSDTGYVVIRADIGAEVEVASQLSTTVRARKLVVTDHDGGWGLPPRSFADLNTHLEPMRSQLADRQNGAVVDAIECALQGGVSSVNLCRPEDIDTELFTFDGAGTLFTHDGYLELGTLGVDDLESVERLIDQGIADGLLRPRRRHEIARLAVNGLGAKVRGSGHLAGIAFLELDRYQPQRTGEVACLYTVSRFSGAGAGALLVEGLLSEARERGLESLFAVTVSEAAAAFFERHGFGEVSHGDVPEAKWNGYDPARLSRARVFKRSLDGF